MLALPIALMAFVVPLALGARAAAPTVTEVSRKVLYPPFHRYLPGVPPNYRCTKWFRARTSTPPTPLTAG